MKNRRTPTRISRMGAAAMFFHAGAIRGGIRIGRNRNPCLSAFIRGLIDQAVRRGERKF